MHLFASAVIFGGIITEQPEVQEISCTGEKLEWGKIAFVEWGGVGPDPADAIFLQQMDELREVPARMSEFDGESKRPGQLSEKFAQRQFPVFWSKRRRQLDENDLQLRRQRLDRGKKLVQLVRAVP